MTRLARLAQGCLKMLPILKKDVEAAAKSVDEHVLVGVTSAEPFTRYLGRAKVIKAETGAEDHDFLVDGGQFEGFVDPRERVSDANSIIVLAVYSYDEECVDFGAEKDLRGRIARTYAYYAVARVVANGVSDFLIEKGFKSASGEMFQPLKVAASRAGLGFQGKHSILITKPYGSWVALRAIITNAEIEPDDPYGDSECGGCVACSKACPTGAIYKPFGVNPKRCINPLTRLPRYITPEIRVKMDARLHGCDICQEACPKNRSLEPRKRSKYADLPAEVSYGVNLQQEPSHLAQEHFPKLIPLLESSKSALIRRNAAIILGNLGDPRALHALRQQLRKKDRFVTPYIRYAIQQIERPNPP